MNVLYINHYAGSEFHGMEFRPYFLAKEWKKMNINTTIIAADFSHLRKYNPIIRKDFEENDVNGINYCWIKTVKYNGNGILRVLSMIQFVFKLLINSKKIIRKYNPDVVICSSTYPLDTYAGQLISKLAKARLIHEVHDLWPLTPMELGGYNKNHPFIKVLQIAEKSAYKNSSVIISILPNINEYVNSLGINKRIIHIPNGILLNQENKTILYNSEIVNKIEQLHNEDYFVVGYAGGLSISNAIFDLLRAAKLLINEKIAFIIVGDGIEKNKLIEFKKENNLNKVYFFDSIKKEEVYGTLLVMDALYIGSKKSKLYKYGFSANKIFDYMLTGKPIIDAIDSEHSPLRYSNVSIKAEAENVESIAQAIKKASLLTNEELDDLRKKSIQYVKSNHDYQKLAIRFKNEFI